MKKLFTFLITFIFCAVSMAQLKSIGAMYYDSVMFKKTGGNSEIILQNGTRDTIGFLFNKGNGRTIFKRACIKLNDSTYLIGADSLKIKSIDTTGKWVNNLIIRNDSLFKKIANTLSFIGKVNNPTDTSNLSHRIDSLITTVIEYPVSGGGSYAAGGSGVTIFLPSSQTGIYYELIKNGTSVLDNLDGTGSRIDFINVSAAGCYTIRATNLSLDVPEVKLMTGSVLVSIISSGGGATTLAQAMNGGTNLTGTDSTTIKLHDSASFTIKSDNVYDENLEDSMPFINLKVDSTGIHGQAVKTGLFNHKWLKNALNISYDMGTIGDNYYSPYDGIKKRGFQIFGLGVGNNSLGHKHFYLGWGNGQDTASYDTYDVGDKNSTSVASVHNFHIGFENSTVGSTRTYSIGNSLSNNGDMTTQLFGSALSSVSNSNTSLSGWNSNIESSVYVTGIGKSNNINSVQTSTILGEKNEVSHSYFVDLLGYENKITKLRKGAIIGKTNYVGQTTSINEPSYVYMFGEYNKDTLGYSKVTLLGRNQYADTNNIAKFGTSRNGFVGVKGPDVGDSVTKPYVYTPNSVAIGSNLVPPDSSASVDLKATNKGFLVNRLTNLQRDSINNPAPNLLIFSITDGIFEVFNGDLWVPLYNVSGVPTQPRKYVAILNQSGTGDPTVTVLTNTFPFSITWTRTMAGVYNAACSSCFVNNKTTTTQGMWVLDSDLNDSGPIQGMRLDNDNYLLNTTDPDGHTTADGKLTNYTITIEVYP